MSLSWLQVHCNPKWVTLDHWVGVRTILQTVITVLLTSWRIWHIWHVFRACRSGEVLTTSERMNVFRFALVLICLLGLQGPRITSAEPPHWYHYTRPTAEFGRPLQVLVIFGQWEDKPDDAPLMPQNLSSSLASTALFYKDMSWGALTFNYTYAPVITLSAAECPSQTCGAGTVKELLTAGAAAKGYQYCGKPCASDVNAVGAYDQLIMAFHGHNPTWHWAGIGVVGNGVTWVKIGSSDAAVMEHEIGHNYGIFHGLTANYERDDAFNADQYPRFTRMEAGGAVYVDNPGSRFHDNGHFGICIKKHNGWLNASNIIRIHQDGPAAAGCPDCQASGSYKIYPFDRPDVTPADGKLMGLELEYSDGRFLHIYYRAAHPSTNKGAALTYCIRDLHGHLDTGAHFTEITEDVAGNTYVLEDAAILPGTTFVATPAFKVRQVDANDVHQVPAVHVRSVTNWTGCTADYICPDGHDISVTVDLWFQNVSAPPAPDRTARTDADAPAAGSTAAARTLLRVSDGSDMNMRGAGGEGAFSLGVCPEYEASVYLYDNYPYSVMQQAAPMGYNAFYSFSLAPLLACACRTDAGGSVRPLTATGYRAVKIINEGTTYMNLAEVVVPRVGGGSCMTDSRCYAFRKEAGLAYTGGWFSTSEKNGLEPNLNDGDLTTTTHMGYPGRRGDFYLCIFDDVCEIQTVKIYTPQDSFNRGFADQYTLELWAFAAETGNTDELRGARDASQYTPGPAPGWDVPSTPVLMGMVENHTILADSHVADADGTKSLTYYPVVRPAANWSVNFSCGYTTTPDLQFNFVSGQAYVLINKDAGSGQMTYSLNATRTACVSNAFQQPRRCEACPRTLLTLAGDVSVCAAAASSCGLVNLGPEGDATSGADGLFSLQPTTKNGHPFYRSELGSKLLFRSTDANARWVITAEADESTVLAQKSGDGFGAFTATNALTSGATAKNSAAIRVVKVTQWDESHHLNLAEIEILSRDKVPVNLARHNATCYSGPTAGYWYNGNRDTTEQPMLNDGWLNTSSHSGDNPGKSAYDICVLDRAYDIASVRIYPRQTHGFRSADLKVEFWSDFIPAPGGLSPTYAPDADLGQLLYSNVGDFSATAGTAIEICSEVIQGPAAEEPACSPDAEDVGEFVRVERQDCPAVVVQVAYSWPALPIAVPPFTPASPLPLGQDTEVARHSTAI